MPDAQQGNSGNVPGAPRKRISRATLSVAGVTQRSLAEVRVAGEEGSQARKDAAGR